MMTTGKTVLLVEDNPHNRKIFSGMLAHAGFRVVEAVDGNEAMAKLASEKPHLVLMDLSIPGIDGWECTRRIKGDPATKDTPVIALMSLSGISSAVPSAFASSRASSRVRAVASG